jgi:outer membrane biogenesis lipoprotein LolB
MSRRHLSLTIVAVASLILTACSSSPTAPQSQRTGASSANADLSAPAPDTTGRSGWIGSSG